MFISLLAVPTGLVVYTVGMRVVVLVVDTVAFITLLGPVVTVLTVGLILEDLETSIAEAVFMEIDALVVTSSPAEATPVQSGPSNAAMLTV